MFAVKYYYDVGQRCDYKLFETVGDALKWWTGNKRLKEQASFYDRLYVLPPGLKDPVQWCIDNIKVVADA